MDVVELIKISINFSLVCRYLQKHRHPPKTLSSSKNTVILREGGGSKTMLNLLVFLDSPPSRRMTVLKLIISTYMNHPCLQANFQ